MGLTSWASGLGRPHDRPRRELISSGGCAIGLPGRAGGRRQENKEEEESIGFDDRAGPWAAHSLSALSVLSRRLCFELNDPGPRAAGGGKKRARRKWAGESDNFD